MGRPPGRRHRAPHAVPAARGREARPHPARVPGCARRPRRGHRAHPSFARRRRGPHRPDGPAVRRRDPGARDPRAAAPSPRGPGAPEDPRRGRGTRAQDRRLPGHPGVGEPSALDHPRRAQRDRRPLRRRPPHRDHVRLRRRHVDGRPDPRRGDGRHHHPRWLRQAHAERPVPLAAPRWPRCPWGPAPRRRHRRALLRHDDAPLAPVPHRPGTGLPRQGVRAAGGRP
ncbi:DNA gyrase, A subunit (fragment) [Bacillus mycoides]|uniref:DNA gyrase, A subunit n=1 Tax=Bacillus mycoides TaxID=1405 RepID=A0A653VYI2_BACMY